MPELKKAELIETDAILEQDLESPEHADFVARLEQTGTT